MMQLNMTLPSYPPLLTHAHLEVHCDDDAAEHDDPGLWVGGGRRGGGVAGLVEGGGGGGGGHRIGGHMQQRPRRQGMNRTCRACASGILQLPLTPHTPMQGYCCSLQVQRVSIPCMSRTGDL